MKIYTPKFWDMNPNIDPAFWTTVESSVSFGDPKDAEEFGRQTYGEAYAGLAVEDSNYVF